jgi:hypothetical protein
LNGTYKDAAIAASFWTLRQRRWIGILALGKSPKVRKQPKFPAAILFFSILYSGMISSLRFPNFSLF